MHTACCSSSQIFANFALFAKTAVRSANPEPSDRPLVHAKLAKRREIRQNYSDGLRRSSMSKF